MVWIRFIWLLAVPAIALACSDIEPIASNEPGFIFTFAGGRSGYSGDGKLAHEAKFRRISAIDFDAAGNAYVLDSISQNIRRIDAVTGIITTIVGVGGVDPSVEGELAFEEDETQPRDLKVSADGRHIYVSGTINAPAPRTPFLWEIDQFERSIRKIQLPDSLEKIVLIIDIDELGNIYFEGREFEIHRINPESGAVEIVVTGPTIRKFAVVDSSQIIVLTRAFFNGMDLRDRFLLINMVDGSVEVLADSTDPGYFHWGTNHLRFWLFPVRLLALMTWMLVQTATSMFWIRPPELVATLV